MKQKLIRIATRQSKLALWQANYIKQKLASHYPAVKIELLPLITTGDKHLHEPLNEIGGKRLFVKELEQALLDGAADLAVHSMKDVPMDLPANLTIPVICEREDPRDVLVSNKFNKITELPPGAVVGTSSLRRAAQLHALRPDLIIQPMRGNIDTRMQRLDEGKYDAIVLAAAGLLRLGLRERIGEFIAPEACLPAVGQGALGIECRADDEEILALIKILDHQATHVCVQAERAMNHRLNGGCQVPIAAYATLKNEQLHLYGMVGKPDGSLILQANAQGFMQDSEELGMRVAEDLLAQGAMEVLQFSL